MKKVLTEEKKDSILRLKNDNWTWKNISKSVNSPIETCISFYKRHRQTAGLPPKIKVPKTMIKGRLARGIKKIVEENPSISYRDLTEEVKREFGTSQRTPSKSTCHRFLKQSGYKIIKLWKKPIISDVNKRKRVDFSQDSLSKPTEFWERVIWSDETTVRSNPKSQDIFVKVHNSVNREDLPVNGKCQSQGISVMFWGCFSKLGMGPLVAIEGTLDGERYKQLLEEYLKPEIDAAELPMVFMQDNAPCHTARVVTQFFAENEIETLNWPPQSPDMNPIENLWSIIKQRRRKRFGPPKTRDELIDQIFAVWEEIDDTLRNSLADSVCNRFIEVLRLNGRPSKY